MTAAARVFHGSTGVFLTLNSGSAFCLCSSVNVGDYIEAVLDRNLAENISRVLYPNDNVSLQAALCQVHSTITGDRRAHTT